jgi:hypothetical protein
VLADDAIRNTLAEQTAHHSKAKPIDEMIESLRAAADQLHEMRRAGVILDDRSGMTDDYATLVTTDPTFANKFGMEEEREYLEEEDDEAAHAAV